MVEPLQTVGLPDDRQTRAAILALEKDIRDLTNPVLSRTLNGTRDDGIYLASSWLGAIYHHARRIQGDDRRTPRHWSRERQLGAVCNRLGLDFETVLEADPVEELTLIRDALEDLD